MMAFEDLPEKHLPEDFAERLVASVRSRRRSRWLGTVSIAVAVTIVAVGLFGYFASEEPKMPGEAALVAARTQTTNDSQVSAFMLIGFFRECFKHCKNNKKKEEE